MKNAIVHLKNNFWTYFIAFSTLLSIIGIIGGAIVIKTGQHDNPLLTVGAISNIFWFLFIFFSPIPCLKSWPEVTIENLRAYEEQRVKWEQTHTVKVYDEKTEITIETDEEVYNDQSVEWGNIRAAIIAIILGLIMLTNFCFGLTLAISDPETLNIIRRNN